MAKLLAEKVVLISKAGRIADSTGEHGTGIEIEYEEPDLECTQRMVLFLNPEDVERFRYAQCVRIKIEDADEL